ncbi:MAG: hypothetical protein V3W18_12740 [candidate division Zixibacteria bacterium]
MKEEKRHIQLRLSPELREELETLSQKYTMSVSDIVRGVLLFGIPVFETLTDLRGELVERLVTVLKKESRI